ncbi:hypothetical protein R1sor_000532 [Riccia sorocarpa]|uniref:Uncharacterized protein n=1 Tax=Riccia sorocarpa TaxID=122646 RepID=A0ABD3GWL1_9MARC
MTVGAHSTPALHHRRVDVYSGATTSALTSPPLRLFSGLSWRSTLVGRSSISADLCRKYSEGRDFGLRIYAARKNVTSRKIQQSKGRMTERPSKLGTVGAPFESNPLIQGNNLSVDSVLNEDQAIGQVITAQANFMRVAVERGGKSDSVTNLKVDEDGGNMHEQDGGRVGIDESLADFSLARNAGDDMQTAVLESAFRKPPEERVELLCVVRSLLKKIKRRVLVGDRVLVSGIDWTEKRGMIEEVLDRTSEIVDPPMANVDNLLVVFSIDHPQIDEKVLSRFLLEAESTGIDFTLVLNKIDLVEEKVVESWQAKLAEWGYKAVLCSADRKLGLRALTSVMKNKVTVIVGPSGVGKSSLINALHDQSVLPLWYNTEEMQEAATVSVTDTINGAEVSEHQFAEDFEELRVGEVSTASGRGRHTTRHVRLLPVPGGVGLLADTPGFSQPSLAKVTSSTLAQLFPEVRRRLAESEGGGCGFPNCMHLGEPYCAVGDSWERYYHYTDLLEEVRTRERVQKKVLGTKRESDMRVKKMGAEGVKKSEPRLALNRHRRESRKQANQAVEEFFREEEELEADMKDASENEARAV